MLGDRSFLIRVGVRHEGGDLVATSVYVPVKTFQRCCLLSVAGRRCYVGIVACLVVRSLALSIPSKEPDRFLSS
jgi:hypothetical protein